MVQYGISLSAPASEAEPLRFVCVTDPVEKRRQFGFGSIKAISY